MGLGGLSEMLGMGMVIQLRNMFSVPAQAIERSSRALTTSIIGDQARITSGFRLMAGGAATMLLGTGIYVGFAHFGKQVLDMSSKLEILHNQIRVLSRDNTIGDNLYNKLTKFAVETPFTIDQVFGAGKNLLAFGFSANRVMDQMRLTGEWAAMMNRPIDEVAAIIGKVKAGAFGYAMRSMQVMGIGYRDIERFGGPISPKTHTTMRGADPEKFLAALNMAIKEKFLGGMALYMQTIPGMASNIKDQLILMAGSIGDQIKPAIKQMMAGILSVFRPDIVQPFAKALGGGLLMVIKLVSAVVIPMAKFGLWMMTIAQTHPMFIKLGMVLLFLAGTLLNLVGVTMLVVGAFRILQYFFAAAQVTALVESIWAMAGPIGWIIGAIVLFGVAWSNNFLHIRDVAMYFYDSMRLVAVGTVQLLTTLTGGVGYLSKSTYDALGKAGLLGLVTGLFMLFYRLGYFVKGAWDMIQLGAKALAYVGSIALWLLSPIMGVVYAVYKVAEGLGWVGNQMSSHNWYGFGATVTGIAMAMLAARTITWLWAAATLALRAFWMASTVILNIVNGAIWLFSNAARIATSVQWAWNAAMAANPIGLVVIAIALAIGLTVAFFMHLKQISGWFEKLPTWAQLLIGALLPMVYIPIWIYQHWDQLKTWFGTFGAWLSKLWDTVIDYLQNKIFGLLGWLRKIVGNVGDWLTGSDSGPTGPVYATATGPQLTSQQMDNLSRHREQMAAVYAANSQSTSTQQLGDHVDKLMAAMRDRPHEVHTVVHLDSKVVGRSVTRYQGNRRDGDNY